MVQKTAYTAKHDNLERWLLTYADMITLLTAFFLMMYSMSVVSKGKFTAMAASVRSGFGSVLNGGDGILNNSGAPSAKKTLTPYQESMQNLRLYVEQNNLKGKITARSDERGLVISLAADNLLFERGQARILPQNSGALDKVAQIIKSVTNQVEIEGHTDDLPIHTAQFPSNWELSAGRAAAVLRQMTEQNGLPGTRFRAAGYADTKPLAPNTTEANRARNRRVDIVILKTDSQREADLVRKSEIQRITGSATGHNPENAAPLDDGPLLEP